LFDEETIRAVSFLKKTENYMDTNIGAGGRVSPEAYAFNVVSKNPNSTKIFHHIYETGGNVGKIYALIGLYYDDREFVYQEIEYLLTLDSGEELLPDCGLSMNRLLKSDSPLAVRLSEECPTISSWVDVYSSTDRSFKVDVYGGSLSEEFFNAEPIRAYDLKEVLKMREERKNVLKELWGEEGVSQRKKGKGVSPVI